MFVYRKTDQNPAPSAAAAKPQPVAIAAVATAGHYLALRIGFAFPMEEVNALPAPWVESYTKGGFMLVDPLLRWAYANEGACRWSDLAGRDGAGVLAQAAGHGLRFGAVVSVLDRDRAQRSFGTFARADRELADDEVASLARLLEARHDALAPPSNITRAEVEALRLVKSGQRLKQIAWQLGVTEGAIKQRLKSARLKLSAKTGAEAISRAASFGLI